MPQPGRAGLQECHNNHKKRSPYLCKAILAQQGPQSSADTHIPALMPGDPFPNTVIFLESLMAWGDEATTKVNASDTNCTSGLQDAAHFLKSAPRFQQVFQHGMSENSIE